MRRKADPAMPKPLINRVRELAFATGAQALGVAPAERFSQAPRPYWPSSYLPGARSVVVVGVHYPDACVEECGDKDLQAMNAYGIVQVDMNILLDVLSFRIARLLDREGFGAVSFSTSHIWRYRPFGEIARSFTPDFAHRHAAVAAGLGEFGWNGLVINPEFGPRIRFNCIITQAELPPTPMYAGPALCDKCMRCVKHCSMDTFRKEVAGLDRVVIGGREFKFPHTNKWRCAWAEHFALGLNVPIPDKIDERSVLAAKHRYGVFGGEIGNCLRQCLPPDARTAPVATDSTVWRRRKAPPTGGTAPLLRDLRRLAPRPDYLAVLPVAELPPDLLTSELPGTQALLVLGVNLPRDLPDLEILGHAGDLPAGLQEATAFSREEGNRLLALLGHQAAMLAEQHGYDAMPRVALKADRLAALCGWGDFSGDGRLFRTRTHGTNSLFTVVALTAPLPRTIVKERRPKPAPCTREALEKAARAQGVDLFGVAPLQRLEAFPAVRELQRLYPALRNAVVLGMHYPDGYLAPGPEAPTGALGTYSFAQYQTHRELGWAALALCRQLEASGQAGLPILDLGGKASKTLNVRGTPPADAAMDRGMIGLLPFAFIPDHRANALAAVAAGLGALGYHGAALTPEFGVRQRFICILTDLDLKADPLSNFDPGCTACRRCLDACPTAALDRRRKESLSVGGRTLRIPRLDAPRCDWAKRFGLVGASGPEAQGSTTDIPPPETISLKAIHEAMEARDPLQDHFASILEPCIRVCPGRRPTEA